MIPDGAGGAIIIWEDRRTERDIYAQRFNNAGTIQWPANGMVVCDATGTQEEPQLIAGTSGGAILLWTDSRNSSQPDVYAQRIDASGAPLWITNGVPVATELHAQFAAQLVPGGTGEAIIAWVDLRNTLDYDIYSSKLFSDGTLPLRILSFTAANSKNDVVLSWVTDNETASAYFDIEYSTNGLSFTKVGQVKSKNTPGRNDYSFTHVSPGSTILYYRLKQVDIDGQFEYSTTIRTTITQTVQLLAYPNPAGNYVQLKNCNAAEIQSIDVFTTDGKKAITLPVNTRMQYDINSLKPGMYIIRLVKKDGIASVLQFVKH